MKFNGFGVTLAYKFFLNWKLEDRVKVECIDKQYIYFYQGIVLFKVGGGRNIHKSTRCIAHLRVKTVCWF